MSDPKIGVLRAYLPHGVEASDHTRSACFHAAYAYAATAGFWFTPDDYRGYHVDDRGGYHEWIVHRQRVGPMIPEPSAEKVNRLLGWET